MINLSQIPKNPGCYLFKDLNGNIIYIGKAKDLSKRVKSYFQKRDHDAKTTSLVKKISDVEYILTDTEVEALILENNLIKKHKPHYNISLKDSKRYAYLQITNEEFPRLLLARKRSETGEFYGPFISATTRDYVIEALRKTFKLRTCKKLPKRACLQYSIGLCDAPCVNKISKSDYMANIDAVRMVLKGKTEKLVKILFFKMKDSSLKQNYEKALNYRNQIESVKYLHEKQKVERQKKYDEDIINYIIKEDQVYLTLFNSKRGILESKQDFELDFKEGFLEEFISRYYFENEPPKFILIPSIISEAVQTYLRKISKIKVKILVPIKGEKKELLNLVKKNLEQKFFGDIEKLKELKEKLNLAKNPEVIECFDISHLSGKDTVASMVQFRNAVPNKSNYRKFKIKTTDGIDDFAAIKEVVYRRYYKLKKEKLKYPDLVIIDGGKGQLTSALDAFKELDIKLPIIAIAKREEEIFIPGKKASLKLSEKSKALKLVIQMRDEAHRFAINYQKLLRKKKIRAS